MRVAENGLVRVTTKVQFWEGGTLYRGSVLSIDFELHTLVVKLEDDTEKTMNAAEVYRLYPHPAGNTKALRANNPLCDKCNGTGQRSRLVPFGKQKECKDCYGKGRRPPTASGTATATSTTTASHPPYGREQVDLRTPEAIPPKQAAPTPDEDDEVAASATMA